MWATYSMQIAQVHRATLLDGKEVVVKVQHDGVKAIILEVRSAYLFYHLECLALKVVEVLK